MATKKKAKKDTQNYSFKLNGTIHKIIEVHQVDSPRESIRLDKISDKGWRLIWSGDVIDTFSDLEGIEFITE